MARLRDRLRLLTGGSWTAPRRQQALRLTLDWSYDLLTEPERVVLRRLAVFAGGCTLSAAERVCGQKAAASETDLPVGVLDLATQLVARSRRPWG